MSKSEKFPWCSKCGIMVTNFDSHRCFPFEWTDLLSESDESSYGRLYASCKEIAAEKAAAELYADHEDAPDLFYALIVVRDGAGVKYYFSLAAEAEITFDIEEIPRPEVT